jgi:poly(3-hydroxybutyrate) depolymerase
MNPDRHATSHYDYFKDLIKGDDASVEAHRKFYDEYNAVLDMDADYYLETIRAVFQDFLLVHGTWDIKAADGSLERVKPQDIVHTALLTVEGELDDISGSGQTEAAHGLCEGIPAEMREHLEAKGAGHYGIFAGRRWRDVVYPKVRAFIAAHDAKQKRSGTPAIAHVQAELTSEDAMIVEPKVAAKPAAAERVAAETPIAVATPNEPAAPAPASKAESTAKPAVPDVATATAAPAKKSAPSAKKAATAVGKPVAVATSAAAKKRPTSAKATTTAVPATSPAAKKASRVARKPRA